MVLRDESRDLLAYKIMKLPGLPVVKECKALCRPKKIGGLGGFFFCRRQSHIEN